ncbi:hypothetical protein [Vibrio crassostreae]|uniref:hypothetical protein n=1 Tax=Vibrio crassostreae TaxID=246167 RepID=UPI0006391598|nr:hypothetical protein [Vibrio crassostreae]CDT76635.1 hypothetical protein VCRLGP8_990047 [Vibrio crassostreae]
MLRNYDPFAKWYQESWTLSSDGLFDKWGFSDGNMFDELCLDSELNEILPDSKEVLKIVVEQFLLPQIPHPVALYDANTSHNRVRADNELQNQFEPIEITVNGEQIFEMLKNLS